MPIQTQQPAIINFPITSLKPLYRNQQGDKLIIEVDIEAMKTVNEPNNIDEMVAEARLEYALGKTKNFDSAEELIKELRA